LTSSNVACDGCDGIRECRHNGPQPISAGGESRRAGDAVTNDSSDRIEISSPDREVTVLLSKEPPAVTPRVARALLDILVELTGVPVLDQPAEGATDVS
jgi:hypothetical protein